MSGTLVVAVNKEWLFAKSGFTESDCSLSHPEHFVNPVRNRTDQSRLSYLKVLNLVVLRIMYKF